MKELYFLTILDGVNSFLNTATGIGLVIGTVLVVFYALLRMIEKQNIPAIKNWGITLISLGVSFGFVNVFIPTTEQATMIYGVGTVVDYVQNNEDIQKLPDKCVKALDLWVDKYLEEQQVKK